MFFSGNYITVFTLQPRNDNVHCKILPEDTNFIDPCCAFKLGTNRFVDCVILFLYALYHMKRVPVCFWQDNINLMLQMSAQHISKVREKASFSVAVFTEDDTYSSGSSIQNIMMGHLTCQKRKAQILKYQTRNVWNAES